MKPETWNFTTLTRGAALVFAAGIFSTQAGCTHTVSARPARTVTVVQTPYPVAAAVPAPGPVVVPTTIPVAPLPTGARLATLHRYADQYDEYFVRGDAAVADSPVFSDGIRLAAWDSPDPNHAARVAVASAVYLFNVPTGTATVRLEVGYRRAEVASDTAVAGLVYVRNLAVEAQYKPDAEPDGEPGFYGDSYVLPGNDTQAVFDLAAADRVINGVLELHLSAGAGQALDVDYVRMTALAAPAQAQPRIVYETVPMPYVYTYRYYYIGPWHRCHADHVVVYTFHVEDVNPFFWGGWVTYRAVFFTYHPWVYRPVVYRYPVLVHHHRPRPFVHRPPVLISYRQDWYRRHFRVDTARLTEQDLDRRVRTHHDVRPPQDRLRHEQEQHRIAETVRQSQDRLRRAEGNRYHDRIATWSQNPQRARQDLRTFGDRDPDVRQARATWQHRPPTPTATPPTVSTMPVTPAAAPGPVRPPESNTAPKPRPEEHGEHGADRPRPAHGKPADDRKPGKANSEPAANVASEQTGNHALAPAPDAPRADTRPRPKPDSAGAKPHDAPRPAPQPAVASPAAAAPGAAGNPSDAVTATASEAAGRKPRPGVERHSPPSGHTPPERTATLSVPPGQAAPVTPTPAPSAPTRPPGVQPAAPVSTPAAPAAPQPAERRSARPERTVQDRGPDTRVPAPETRPATPQPADFGAASRRDPGWRMPAPVPTPAPAAPPVPAPAPAVEPGAAPAAVVPPLATMYGAESSAENDKRGRKDERTRERNGRH